MPVEDEFDMWTPNMWTPNMCDFDTPEAPNKTLTSRYVFKDDGDKQCIEIHVFSFIGVDGISAVLL